MVKEKIEQAESEKSDSMNEGDKNYLTVHFYLTINKEIKVCSNFICSLNFNLPENFVNSPEIPPPNCL
jgi:hypothetical protein